MTRHTGRRAACLWGVALTLAACAGAGQPDGGDAGTPDAAADAARDVTPGIPREWAPNDVSILWPLPTPATRAQFIHYVRPAGESGPYVPPLAADEEFPPALHADLPRAGTYASAELVALRYDPCGHRAGVEGCEAQLRVAFQALDESLDDTGVHLFYRLDAASAADVEERLWALRERSPVRTGGPLDVHPALAADPGGATASGLRGLLAAHAREDNLVRATFNTFSFDNWNFQQFERDAGGFRAVPIAALPGGTDAQSWLRLATVDDTEDPTGRIDPAPSDGFDYFLSRTTFEAALDPARGPRAARCCAWRTRACCATTTATA